VKPPARLLPSTGVSLLLLVAVILLATHWGRGARLSHSGLIPGLTYEVERPAHGVSRLVVTSVEDEGPAASAGIAVGDVIERIDDRPVTALADVVATSRQSGMRDIRMVVRHQGTDRYMQLPATGG
jgi:C-terminal processing protease CtpA/Prc